MSSRALSTSSVLLVVAITSLVPAACEPSAGAGHPGLTEPQLRSQPTAAAMQSPVDRFAFVAGGGQPGIYAAHLDGTGRIRLTDDGNAVAEPAWSPDGRRIAFTHFTEDAGEYHLQLWTVNADGSGQTQLLASGHFDIVGSWAPSGQELVFTRFFPNTPPGSFGEYGTYVLDLQSGAVRVLVDEPGQDEVSPAWSPDGRHIAFARVPTEGTDRDVFVVNADGSGLTSLTDGVAGHHGQPAWSPDGRRIVFWSSRAGGGDADLWIMNADGSEAVQLTDGPDDDQEPVWSQDGRWILFVRYHAGGESDLWAITPDGSELTQVTDGAGFEFSPAWAR